MGKGKITVQLKGRLFDSMNTFSLDGTLSGMEAGELNPMLENNAAIYVTSGKIESMNFNISADNTNATGEMFLRYHGLNIRLKNKKTNETTAIKEKLGSIVANMIILDANPQSDKALRKGVIDYRRDPEKSLVNYCAHSILSGIKSSLTMQKN
jgi:hypothetical protein